MSTTATQALQGTKLYFVSVQHMMGGWLPNTIFACHIEANNPAEAREITREMYQQELPPEEIAKLDIITRGAAGLLVKPPLSECQIKVRKSTADRCNAVNVALPQNREALA